MKGRTLHAHDIETCAESACELLRPGCCAAFSINDTRSGKDADEQLVLFAEVRDARRFRALLSPL